MTWINKLLRYLPLSCYLLGAGGCAVAVLWPTEPPVQREMIVIWDRSPSVTAALGGEQLPMWVNALADSADSVRVVSLAGRARLLPGGRAALSAPLAPLNDAVDGAASDYAEALRLAMSLPRRGPTRRRIVIAGDGRATRGDAVGVARELITQARLETIALGGRPHPDAQILSLQGPGTGRMGSETVWRVMARSTQAERCVIELFSAQQPLARCPVLLTPAVQAVSFTVTLPGRGWQLVRARVTLAGDAVRENDVAVAGVIVTGAARVLWVGSGSPVRLPGAVVERCRPADFAALDLSAVGAIVLDNVAATALPIGTGKRLRAAVGRGLALLVIGGDNSLRAGGYDRPRGDDLALANLLPVRLTPPGSLAVAFGIDRSGSMGEALPGAADGTTKLSQAASAVWASWRQLGAGDHAGIVSFSRNVHTTLPLTRVSDADVNKQNATKMHEALRALRAGGGTSLFAGITRCLDMLKGQRAKTRQVIILTDGTTVEKAAAQIPLLAKIKSRLVEEQTRLTLIVVGADADRALLASCKNIGAEIIPAATRLLVLPEILSRAVQRDDGRQSGTVGAVARHRSMRNLTPQSLPPLRQYRALGAIYQKRGAVALMSSTTGEVLAATWRLGMGRVSVIAGAPRRDWGWSKVGEKFTARLLTHTAHLDARSVEAAARRVGEALHVSVVEMSGVANEDPRLPWRARVVSAAVDVDGATQSAQADNSPLPWVKLRPSSPGVWTGSGAAPPPGVYRVEIIAPASGAVVAVCPLVIDGQAEYRYFGPDGRALARLALAGGGDLVSAANQCLPWAAIPVVRGEEKREISRPLLVAGILLLLSGLLIRAWR